LEHKLIVLTSNLLREKKFGVFEGKTEKEMSNQLKKEVILMNSLSTKNRMKYRLHPSFETDAEAISRLLTFLRQTSLAYPDKKILVVAHGGIMRTLLIHLGVADYKDLPRGSIKNAGYIVLKSDGIEFFIKKLHGIEITSV
jgi:broad specificity phosphatase PhoE